MILGRYRQQPGDDRKRAVDFTNWLEDNEVITNVAVAVDPSGLTVHDVLVDPDGLFFAYFAGGGVDGTTYKVTFTTTTNAGQVREDEIEIEVEEF